MKRCFRLVAWLETVISNMTANGNLGNPDDTEVECSNSYKQQILSNSCLAVGLRVKPNGYAKYIDVELGFKTA